MTDLRDENKEDVLAVEVRQLLKPFRDQSFEASPYLKTRVLARVREVESSRLSCLGWVKGWKSQLATSVCAVSIVSLFWLMFSVKSVQYVATVQQPVAVRVDLKGLGTGASHAKVELSGDVRFYSARFPEVREKKTLDVAWKSATAPMSLPIVIRSESGGMKAVRVKFYNDRDQVVAERVLKIRFDAARVNSRLELTERSEA